MYVEKINQLLEQSHYGELKELLNELNSVDLAELLQELSPKDSLLVFRMLKKDIAAEVFAEFTKGQRKEMLKSMTEDELSAVLDELYFNDMIDVLEEMPANFVSKLMAEAPPEERKLINQFLKYPEDSAGSVMTIEYVELRPHLTAGEALKGIQETGLTRKTIYTCYITDPEKKLIGFVSLRELIVADADVPIRDIMTDNVVSVEVHEDQEEVAQLFVRYGFLALPVVDTENRLIGIITVDEVMDIMEEEATEDFQIMGATAPSESEYLDTGVLTLAKNRIGWLLVLMFTSIIAGLIIRKYSDFLSHVVILNTFIPVIMSTGGNSGSQSATLIIRALATGDVTLGDSLRVIWKEFRVSILCGVTLSIVNFIRLMLMGHAGAMISLGVSITILFTVIIAKVAGAVLPLLAKRFGADPALMAGPLITTIVDSLGLFVYFAIMSILINMI